MEAMDCIAYYRVSTQKQGLSGLGLAAQKEAVKRYIAADKRRHLVASFEEIESGKKNKRPEIHKAIALCKARGARLVIAKLDRLARNVLFIAQLMETKVDFAACDLPEATPLTIHIMAAMAEHEAKMISERTRRALKQSKKKLGGRRYLKGTRKLWNPGSVAHLAVAARKRNVRERDEPLKILAKSKAHDGLTLIQIGAELERFGHKAPRGGKWHAATVARLLR
jgi:DNA invertase Pin-like site-specific DNA recombinase